MDGEWDEGPPRDPAWRPLDRASPVTIAAVDEGTVTIHAEAPPGAALGARIERRPGERFSGFGIRSDAVHRADGVVENWAGEGPYQLGEYPLISAITPRWAIRQRRDAAYFPVPWTISSGGYGVLVDSPELSRFRFTDEDPGWWSVEVLASRLELRCFAGPSTEAVLRRFTAATGRQPFPAARWFLGPWCQTGHADLVPFERESEILQALVAADAPVSAVETHMRRLPGGAHEGRRDDERRRTQLFHDHGLAGLTYLNPFVSEDYARIYQRATPLLQQRPDGTPYVYPAYIGGREPPLTIEGQLDFSAPAAGELFAELVREAVEDGHDGWMEDFGEYTPPDSRCADGATGERAHNLYPVQFHAAGARAAVQADRPLARFARSGWTGAAPHLPLVWGGDPTTGWGFDGLASAVTQGIAAGLSGIAFWGSDIGGFFTLGEEELDVELLVRWIQFGALSPLMRTKSAGIAIPPRQRPQVWDPEVLPHWRRWAKLHTQLSPYLLGAAAEYVDRGLPLMRDLGLPDQYLLGESLLVAPVLEPGLRERTVDVPAGRWLDLWRSVTYEESTGGLAMGAPRWIEGPAEVRLPAPLEEAPVLVREGAVLPLLPPATWSLAAPGIEGRLHVLAFPAGATTHRFDRGGRLHSTLEPGAWRLEVAAEADIKVDVQAALGFAPATVRVDDGRLEGWSYEPEAGVLRAQFSGRRPIVRAKR